MFGGSPLSNAAAATLFIYSIFLFIINLVFTTSCSWSFYRRRTAMESLGNMVRFPGEPAENFVPPLPPDSKKKKSPSRLTRDGTKSSELVTSRGADVKMRTNAMQKIPKEYDEDDAGGGTQSGDEAYTANQGTNPEVKEHAKVESTDANVESSAMLAVRRAAREGASLLIDLKDPPSCLGWALVRRALRHVVRSPLPRVIVDAATTVQLEIKNSKCLSHSHLKRPGPGCAVNHTILILNWHLTIVCVSTRAS